MAAGPEFLVPTNRRRRRRFTRSRSVDGTPSGRINPENFQQQALLHHVTGWPDLKSVTTYDGPTAVRISPSQKSARFPDSVANFITSSRAFQVSGPAPAEPSSRNSKIESLRGS